MVETAEVAQRQEGGNTRPLLAGTWSVERRHVFVLGLLFVVALALRLYRLDAGLWYDEIQSYLTYGSMSFGEIATTYGSQNQHLLYSLFARLTTALFGDSGWAFRMPAVIFGVASIGAVYLVGASLGRRREGLFAAALLTFSYHHIWFSQNARGYTGLLFWALLSSYFLIRALQEPRRDLWIGYAVTVALGVFTHMTMLFVVVGQFAVFVWESIVRARSTGSFRTGFLWGFVLAGVLTLVLHAFVLGQIIHEFTEGEHGLTFSTWENPLWALLEFVRVLQLGFAGSVVVLGGAVVFGVGVWSWMRTRPALIVLFFLPVVLCGVVSVAMGHNLWPRLFFFAAGFALLIVMRGLFVLGETAARLLRLPETVRPWVGPVLAGLLVALSAVTVPSVYGPKQDHEGALAFVEAHAEPGDAVATTGMTAIPFRDYLEQDWPRVTTAAELEGLQRRAERTWLLYTFPPHMVTVHPDIKALVERDFEEAARFRGTLGGGAILVMVSDKPMP